MANYHVNYLTGSDVTGDGSTGNPWASISYALSASSATTGDVIKVVGSTKTTLDTAAAPNANGRTNVLNTSVDLSTSLAAGDIIIVSPNLSDGAEFNGWMHFEVESVTATTLTTRGYFVFPNVQTGLAMTIEKVNDMVYTDTQETFDASPYVGATIECGYDATFTSVIGHTYFVKADQGVGSRSGTKFQLTNGGTGGWDNVMPLWRNMAFMRWQFSFNLNFGVNLYGNNIHLLNAEAKMGYGGGSIYAPAADGLTTVYLHDCDQAFLDKNYQIYAGNTTTGAWVNGARVHLFANQNRDRQMERNGGAIKHVTAYFIKGFTFGFATLFNQSTNLVINGDVSIIGLDPYYYTQDYYRAAVLASGTAQIVPTSFKVVKNGGQPQWTPYNFVFNLKDNAVPGNSYVKLPAGESILDHWLVGGDIESVINGSCTFVDVNGTWSTHGGTIFFKQNTVDQETGDSCLEILHAKGSTYAGSKVSTFVAAFPGKNAGLKLAQIQIRKKSINGVSASMQWKTPIGGTHSSESVIGTISSGTLTTWNTVSMTLTNQVKRYLDNRTEGDALVPIFMTTSQTNNYSHWLIDSITPIYA